MTRQLHLLDVRPPTETGAPQRWQAAGALASP